MSGRRTNTHLCGLLGLLAWIGPLSGCGDSRPQTVPVSGQVVLKDGSTLARGGQVIFVKVDGPTNSRSTGNFGSDGRFVLKTFEKGDGAIPGDYQVMVVPSVHCHR